MQWHRQLDWRPDDRVWRVAWSFMIGSLLFAVGSFPVYSQNVDPGVVGITFVIGSIFFTLAAAGQLRQTHADSGQSVSRRGDAWWAAVVQLGGTLFFNASTIHAMTEGLSAEEANRLVWAPDFFGSVAFLVASHFGWRCVSGGRAASTSDEAERWSAGLNYGGSVLFMISALAAFTLPTTDEVLNTALVNSGTCAGALCFLVGSYLLLPPRSAAFHPPAGARS